MEHLNFIVEAVEVGPDKVVETRFGKAKTALGSLKTKLG